MRNGERELRIPRSPMETDEEFAAECERPLHPDLECGSCGAADEDFGREFDDLAEEIRLAEDAVNRTLCGCDDLDCGCEPADHNNGKPAEGCRQGGLAMPYVVRQHWTGKREIYSRACALERGTLFIDLDMPFMGKGGCFHE